MRSRDLPHELVAGDALKGGVAADDLQVAGAELGQVQRQRQGQARGLRGAAGLLGRGSRIRRFFLLVQENKGRLLSGGIRADRKSEKQSRQQNPYRCDRLRL